MMEYVLVCLGAALQILFAYCFFSLFLEVRCDKDNLLWLFAAAWLVTSAYGLAGIGGIYGYMMHLLVAVAMLLCVFGESGGRGLGLMVFVVLIPMLADSTARYLASGFSEVIAGAIAAAGKAVPLILTLLLRRIRPMLRLRRSPEEDRDMLLLRQHMELQRESMDALEQTYRLQRRSVHEFEHHLQVLRDLLDRGETASARDYLDRLKTNRSIHLMSVNSHHPVVDVILNQKYQTAQENEIKVQLRVNDLSAVSIPSDSLVVVLTNLLDNAIEACRRVDGYREIRCSILYDDGLYISIRNTSEPVEIVDGKIPTSKQDSLSHGFGLMSVSYVLDKLGAEYTFGYEEGWFHFAAEIE